MKNLLIAALTLFVFTFASAQDRSDSEVKRDFEKGVKSLVKDIRNADSQEKVTELTAKVEKFKNDYKSHQEFLNKAVYPDGYDGFIEKLQDQLHAHHW